MTCGQVLAPAGEHQQGLGFKVHVMVEQKPAQRFAQRGAARLARHDHLMAALLQCFAQPVEMGALACAVDAFQRDEFACNFAHLIMMQLVTRHGQIMLCQAGGKLVRAVALADEIQRLGRRGMHGRLQRARTRHGNRRRREAGTGIGIIGRIAGEVGTAQIAVEVLAQAINHRRIGLQAHVDAQAVDEYAGDHAAARSPGPSPSRRWRP